MCTLSSLDAGCVNTRYSCYSAVPVHVVKAHHHNKVLLKVFFNLVVTRAV